MQNQIEGRRRCDVLRSVLGVHQQPAGTVRLPEWAGVRRQAPGRHRGLRLPVAIELLRGQAAGK